MQRFAFTLGMAALVFAAGCATTGPTRVMLEGDHADALLAMQAWNYGDDRETLIVVEDLVKEAANGRDQGQAMAAAMASFLGSPGTTLDATQFICRQLAIIGTERQVDALAPLLTDPATTNMARYALEEIPGSAVDEALLQALPKTKGDAKVGIIATLGNRRAGAARDALQALTRDADPLIAGAAAAALGQLGS